MWEAFLKGSPLAGSCPEGKNVAIGRETFENAFYVNKSTDYVKGGHKMRKYVMIVLTSIGYRLSEDSAEGLISRC